MRLPLLLICLLAGCERRMMRDLEPTVAPSHGPAVSIAPADARGWYLRALAAEQDGELGIAEYSYQWAIRLDRANVDVHLGYARFLLRQDRPRAAVEALEEPERRAPGDPRVHLLLGDAWHAYGDYDKAERSWWTAAEAGDLPEAWSRLTWHRLDQRDPDGANEAWDRWRAADLDGSAAVDRGKAGVELGREAEALDDLVRGVVGFSASPDDGMLLVEVAERSCRLGTALTWAHDQRLRFREEAAWQGVSARLRAAGPCPAGDRLAEAAALAPADAVPLLERALDADPYSAEVLGTLRAAYDGAGRPDAAREIELRESWTPQVAGKR